MPCTVPDVVTMAENRWETVLTFWAFFDSESFILKCEFVAPIDKLRCPTPKIINFHQLLKNKHTHTKSDSNGLKFSLATRSWGWSDYHTDRGRALGTGSGPHRSLCYFIHLVSLPSCLAPKALNLQSALYFCAQGARSDFEESEFHICYYLCDVSETLCLSGHRVSSVSIFIEYPIKWSYNKGTYFIGCSQKLNETTYAMGLVQGLAQNNSSLNTCLFYCFYGFVFTRIIIT